MQRDITDRKQAEKELKFARAQLFSIFESIPATIDILDPETYEILYMNKYIRDLYGQDGVGKKCYKVFHGFEVPCKFCKNLELLEKKEGEIVQWEYFSETLERNFMTTNRLLRWPDGRRVKLEMSIDVTKRIQAEKALRESEERFSNMFEHTSSGGAVYEPVDNGEDFVFRAFNPAAERITRISREEVLGNRLLDLFPNMDKSGLLGALQRVWKTGQEEHILPFYYKDEIREGWRENRVYKLPTGEIVALFDDVTERKQAEEALRDSKEKYRTVLNSNPDPVIVYDMDGRVLYLNPAFTRVFGWTLEEQKGKNLDNFVPEENWPETRMMINTVTVLGESFSGLETRRYTKDGNILDISISGSCYRDREGNVAASVINLRDITEQRKIETQLQQAQKMEAIGTLAGGIAHDFNNLLMAIQGRTSIMLMNKDSSHPDFEHLRGIEGHVESAADLTKQLLGFARGGKYEVKPTDLNELIKKENRMFGRTKKEITIHEKYEDNLWSVEVDRGQIEQVLLNLYVNAWQAMPGGGDLYLETENVTLDENYVKPFSD